MVSLKDMRTSLAALKDVNNLVAVVHCVHALVLIVGRNAAAADKIVRECRESSPTSEFEFLAEDIILLQGVDRVCAKIRARVDKVDLLFMTPDFLSFASRQVYGEAGFHLDDLDLKSHSGLLVGTSHASLMTSLANEELAVRHPSTSFVHVFPE
ncbi:unnamed protein product [Parascedosporium putredinis]|uniref:Uncharacterized protein n=1 Tax=Parascedosporium putredinis TaxID=1442378 RepID=A0A9P1H048_9PEZI|nr:unnamed protein product [Parascedosporium putredinis]CAI7991386.1 unnamed protein product [Parascedosporium putredinis]